MTTSGRSLQVAIDAAALAWHDDAACAEIGRELFFPARGHEGDAAKAKAVCTGCPVRTPCLEYALEQEERPELVGRHGIYGGTTPDERRRIAHARKEQAA